MSDTQAILKATGGVANLTAKDVENLAQSQSKLTGVDDELIQAGENLLLTFKNVRNEVGAGNDIFTRATKAGSRSGSGRIRDTGICGEDARQGAERSDQGHVLRWAVRA